MAEKNANVAEFLKLESPQDKLRTVCSRAQKCYERGETVAVRLASEQEAERLDGMLWTFHDICFIPHVRFAEAEEPVIEPVIIYCPQDPVGEADVLIEAAGGEAGEHFRNFDHIFDFAEVHDESAREASRRRYKAYQEAGCRMRYIT